jgi:hypothetical protein
MATKRPVSISSVFQLSPFEEVGAKRQYFVHFDQIHPVIRIAHRIGQPLVTGERIIFDHELVLFTGGACRLRLGDRVEELRRGSLLFIKPFVAHSFETDFGAVNEHIAIHFDFHSRVPKWPEGSEQVQSYAVSFPGGVELAPVRTIPHGHWIEESFCSIVEKISVVDTDSLSSAEMTAELEKVLLQLFRWSTPLSVNGEAPSAAYHINNTRIDAALTYIMANLSLEISLEDIAEAAGISRSRLVTLFRQLTAPRRSSSSKKNE